MALTGDGARLALASADMAQAAAAAELLMGNVDAGDASIARALETAISVCYARPWLSSNNWGRLKKAWLPDDNGERDLHNQLVDLRKQTYAHNDTAGGRAPSATFSAPDVLYGVGEAWRPLDRLVLPAIVSLCRKQQLRFFEGAAEEATIQRKASHVR